jgi:hypothetical protein
MTPHQTTSHQTTQHQTTQHQTAQHGTAGGRSHGAVGALSPAIAPAYSRHALSRAQSPSQRRSQLQRASSRVLLGRARALLIEAAAAKTPDDCYLLAHLAALRTAAALLAAQDGPAPKRPSSAWTLLERSEPLFAERAAEFAAGARLRAAIEVGLINAASVEAAQSQLRSALDFLAEAEHHLGFAPVLLAG